jgi:hypothetical protein
MEEVEVKKSRFPNLKDVFNYKDLFGDYPLIFLIKIISSVALVYVITEFYSYHNPLDSLITKYVKKPLPEFNPDPNVFVLWGFIAGFVLYLFTLLKGKFKFFTFIIAIILFGHYLSDPALDWKVGEHVIPSKVEEEKWTWKPIKILYDDKKESEKRIDDATIRASNIIFGLVPFLGGYGIWKRKGWAIAASVGFAIIIGFLYTPNSCLENFDASFCGYETISKEKTWEEYLAGGIFIGLGLIIYIELSYAAIKYENYAEQFKPAGLDMSLLTDAQRKGVSRTLMSLFISYLINLGIMLVITFVVAEIVININDYLSQSDGRIQDSIELNGPYGIVFTSLIFFMFLGFIRMFVGADYQTKEN